MLGEPSANTKHVWFVCHGYGQLANYFLNRFAPVGNGDHLVVAPEGLHRFYVKGYTDRVGASWMTKEERTDDIRDYVSYLDAVYAEVMKQVGRDAKVHVLGFSQGAATVSRWLCMGKAKAHDLILWAGAFPPDIDFKENLYVLSSLRKWVVLGDNDEFINEEQLKEHLALLDRNDMKYELIRFGGKHEVDAAALTELAARITS